MISKETDPEEPDLAWLDRLARDGNGKFSKTINNVVLVLENDPLLKGKIVTDEFAKLWTHSGTSSMEQRRRKA